MVSHCAPKAGYRHSVFFSGNGQLVRVGPCTQPFYNLTKLLCLLAVVQFAPIRSEPQ
jgi:hypothetical protein